MSATLKATPVIPKKGESLPDELKQALSKSYMSDGHSHIFTVSEMGYLSGLSDAEIEGANTLIQLILKYDEVEVWLEY